ncbi:MAG: ATP-binding protein [Myxococcaceae bacterium]
MDIRTQSSLLAGIVGLALGVSMLLRPDRPRSFTRYSAFALILGGFYFASFFNELFAPLTYPWAKRISMGATLILGALVPSAALAFFIDFLNVSPGAARNGRKVAFFSGLLGLAVGLTPLANQSWAKIALSVWVFGALIVSASLLLRRTRQTDSRIERLRYLYLAIGAGLTLLFAAIDFISKFGLPFPTLGPVVSTLYLFFLAQTLLRLRLMDLHELLGKFASQTVLAAMLALVFATLTSWVESNPGLFLFNTVVAAFVMLILVEPLRAKVEERVVAIFFRERFELLRTLSQLSARIANVVDLELLCTMILDAFHETRRVTHASIYLLAEDRPGYRLQSFRGPQPASFLDMSFARGLLNAASSGQKALLLENLDRRIAELRAHGPEGKRGRDEIKRIADIRNAMIHMKAGISVPLVGNDRVLGFVNLWDERVPEAYASDEIAMVLEIAERLASVVESSKLYEKMRERDRLAALGEMAAGLAHEIRNPLGAIKGAAQVLDPRRLPGEDGEFLEVIVDEVNRLNGVVSAFLDYARPMKQNFGPTDLNEVITRTLRLIQNDVPPNVTLKVELGEGLGKIDADAEQLKQVLINLLQNAIQATQNRPGTVTLRTVRPERFSDFRGGHDTVEIQVQDDGPGIPSDQQLHIFVPFFTTKEKGTGLGLAICQRIVKNHQGTISVQSRVGEGSTFFMRFPALPSELSLETPSPDTLSPDALTKTSPPTQGPNPNKPQERLSRRERKKRRAAQS